MLYRFPVYIMPSLKAHGLMVLILTLFCLSARAADHKGHALSDRIEQAHKSGTAFKEVTLFSSAGGAKHTTIVAKETLLQPIASNIQSLYKTPANAISIKMRNEDGKVFTLEMMRSNPVNKLPDMGIIDGTGRHAAVYSVGIHYQGSLAGVQQSIATMSVFANGDVMMLFGNEEGNFVVGKIEDGSGNYIFYNDQQMLQRPEGRCGVKDDGPSLTPANSGIANRGTSVYECSKVQVYWEVANNIFTNKGGLTATQNYITGLFNQFQALYANEQIAMELKSMYVWSVPDGYPISGSSPALEKFKSFWNNLGNSFNGDIAHFLSRDNNGNGGGNGGLGYVGVLCNKQFAYSYSDIYGTFQNIPTYSWDVTVISHETGHNLGSKHTHWCGWNTGSGGTCGSIDNCTTQEAGGTCTTCSSTFLNSAATTAWKGTVMSYCHLGSRGINLANGFGPLPGALIRDEVNSSSCLNPVITATLTPNKICSGDGQIALAFDANNFGTAPYTYLWSNSATTQNVASLSVAGSYTVNVTDSNGCSATFATALDFRAKPGDGLALTEKMPVCCQSTSRTLSLSATAPQNISTCQSVYWLRSTTPLATYGIVKNAVDTTQAANIFASTNAPNGTAGATLTIQPPANCVAPVTYYYTPFVMRLAKAANNITATSTASVAFMSNTIRIGGYTTLQSQTATACDLLDTPASQSLVVTVSGYTGRADSMVLIIQNTGGDLLYNAFGQPGNGTYNISPAAIKGGILQGLKIIAFDFNCATVGTCVASVANVAAARSVNYAAKAAGFDTACNVGTAIRVDFAPTACTNLAIHTAQSLQESASLYPNPASQSVTLKFNAKNTGETVLKVTDLVGKTLLAQPIRYSAGPQQKQIDISGWAKGIYFVNFGSSEWPVQSLKLLVE